MSCIFGGIANSKSRVPLFHLLYGWSPDYTRRRGNRRAELVIQYSHLPLEEEQGCPRYTRPSPNTWPATPQRSLIMTRWQMRKLHKKKGSGLCLLPPKQQQRLHLIELFFSSSLKYVNSHDWLQHISERNIITKIINKKREMNAFKIVTSGVACHHLIIYH